MYDALAQGKSMTHWRTVLRSAAYALCFVLQSSDGHAEDLRSYMHGIEAVQVAPRHFLIFFSSSGLPPKGPRRDRNWSHDVYVADWKNTDSRLKPVLFIQKDEAQEPVSAARASGGNIMLTFEDGWNAPHEVSQRYGVYDSDLHPVYPYPHDVKDGGHSGHVAAVGNYFVVFYSDDWVDGGGVDNLGTGKGVYARIYNSKGHLLRTAGVAANRREWWPMVAGSPSHALLIWQQYVPGKLYANLKMSVIDPKTGHFTAPHILQPGIQYYTYKAGYVPALDSFLVTGTTDSRQGFAYLIDNKGNILARLSCMPATVREAGMAVIGNMAYVPSADNRLMQLKLTSSSITLQAVQLSPIEWSYTGSVGLTRDDSRIHWVSLSKTGLQEADFNLKEAGLPSVTDRCVK